MNKLMIIVAAVFLGVSANAQNSLNGAWLATELVITGGDKAGVYTDLESIIIFSEEHFSMFTNVGDRPDFSNSEARVTDQQKIDLYESFIANSGVYNVSRGTLIRQLVFAENPRDIGSTVESEYQRNGDTLIITTKDSHGVINRITYVSAD
ncbi:MAG: hypothetical protein ACJ0RU_00370 [Candidatus Rariloculaceae bacterium]|tara:strand:- start:133 stop:585 length:453 start_codon:yes stop_codon:yes gene_type:complete